MALAIVGPDAQDDGDSIGARSWAHCAGMHVLGVSLLLRGVGAVCSTRRRGRLQAADAATCAAAALPLAVDACRKYKSLALMGFKGELVAGALVVARGSEEEAVQLCLDAS